jgi:hypothetical protein
VKADAARVEIKPAVREKPHAAGSSETSEPPRQLPDSPLILALRSALEKHPDEARQALEKYDNNDRELLLALLQLTAGIGEGAIDKLSAKQVSETLDHLAALTTHLRQKAPLAFDNVCFCEKIDGFGRYAPLPPRREFQAGCEGRPGERVQVYAELRNFTSKSVAGWYETALESSLEIRDAEGRNVVTLNLGRSADRSRTPRQDYFLNFQLHVPAKLPPGLYTLWVRVKDITAGPAPANKARQATCSLDFKVCPPGSPRRELSAPEQPRP